ncbi:MAG: hypothetical protein HY690_17155 [Chloroflexi bacterium]|nr:hypothetical protein [Chloroflexota bacterium]
MAATQERQAVTQERQAETLQQMAATQERQAETLQRVAQAQEQLAQAQRRMQDDLGRLKQDDLERRYRERPFVYLAALVRRAHALSGDELAALLDHAVAQGQLSQADADQVFLADVVVRGRRREDQAEVYLVAEVSWGVGVEDVQRAARRAALLARAGVQAIPLVAGAWMTPDAEEAARAMRVQWVADRRAARAEPDGGPLAG